MPPKANHSLNLPSHCGGRGGRGEYACHLQKDIIQFGLWSQIKEAHRRVLPLWSTTSMENYLYEATHGPSWKQTIGLVIPCKTRWSDLFCPHKNICVHSLLISNTWTSLVFGKGRPRLGFGKGRPRLGFVAAISALTRPGQCYLFQITGKPYVRSVRTLCWWQKLIAWSVCQIIVLVRCSGTLKHTSNIYKQALSNSNIPNIQG